MVRLTNFNFITCVIMMLFLMAPPRFEPNNTHLVTGQGNDQPSLFILNYAKKENDEQFHMLRNGDAAEYELLNKKSTTSMDTSSTTILIPTTIELTTTEDPTTTEVATTTVTTTPPGPTTESYKQGTRSVYLVSGDPVDREWYPFMVQIGWGKSKKSIEWGCSGTILHPNFALTAAHCLFRIAAVIFVDVSGKLHAAKHVFIHPEYEPSNKFNDIALLQFDNTLKFNGGLYPACLSGQKEWNDDIFALGWDSQSPRKSNTLLYTDYYVVPDRLCKDTPGAPLDISHKAVGCAESFGKSKIVCDKGYDGGPVLHWLKPKNYLRQRTCMRGLIGVITYYPLQCGRSSTKFATFSYTLVAPYIGWIKEVVKKNRPKK